MGAPPSGRQQQRGIDSTVGRRALPASRAMDAVGTHVSQDDVGQNGPCRRLAAGGVAGNCPQSGHACEPGVGPALIIEFPDAGVGLVPPTLDGGNTGFYRSPIFAGEMIVTPGRGQEKQDLTEGVELKLSVDPVADLVETPWISLQMGQDPLVRDRAPVCAIRRFQGRSVLEYPPADEGHGVVE